MIFHGTIKFTLLFYKFNLLNIIVYNVCFIIYKFYKLFYYLTSLRHDINISLLFSIFLFSVSD